MDSSREYDWSKKSILIADDELHNYIILEKAMKKTGIKIFHAENGEQAVKLFKENPDISVILMDIRMPEMGGLEATKFIRSVNRNIPIIAFTAFALSDDEAIALEFGCDDYISKPVRPDYLLKKINEHLTK
ncbi:MAG TPA: response regulator [Bacteroidales bacterium]|jgi:CheY-like chemotaxis protein|nr:response regulator [Bacteroidales bacterium]